MNCARSGSETVNLLHMATNKNKMSLRDDLTCAICFELFKDPVMLVCMHHFCRRCIVSYWKTVRGPVSCPQCRQVFPNKCFQTNYLVAGLVEKVRASSTSASVKYLEVSCLFTVRKRHVCSLVSCFKPSVLWPAWSCFQFNQLFILPYIRGCKEENIWAMSALNEVLFFIKCFLKMSFLILEI